MDTATRSQPLDALTQSVRGGTVTDNARATQLTQITGPRRLARLTARVPAAIGVACVLLTACDRKAPAPGQPPLPSAASSIGNRVAGSPTTLVAARPALPAAAPAAVA